MRPLVITLFVFSIACPVTAQQLTPGILYHTFRKETKLTEQANPFLFEEFMPGGIVLTDGQRLSFARMNHDQAEDVVVVKRNGEEQAVVTKMVKSFYLVPDDDDTIFFDQVSCAKEKSGYYQRLNTHRSFHLLKKVVLEAEKPIEASSTYAATTPKETIVKKSSYFVRDSGGCPVGFKNKKSLLELYPHRRDEINAYIKKNDIDFKKEDEMSALIDYMATLVSSTSTN